MVSGLMEDTLVIIGSFGPVTENISEKFIREFTNLRHMHMNYSYPFLKLNVKHTCACGELNTSVVNRNYCQNEGILSPRHQIKNRHLCNVQRCP